MSMTNPCATGSLIGWLFVILHKCIWTQAVCGFIFYNYPPINLKILLSSFQKWLQKLDVLRVWIEATPLTIVPAPIMCLEARYSRRKHIVPLTFLRSFQCATLLRGERLCQHLSRLTTVPAGTNFHAATGAPLDWRGLGVRKGSCLRVMDDNDFA